MIAHQVMKPLKDHLVFQGNRLAEWLVERSSHLCRMMLLALLNGVAALKAEA